jgi:hypothetical protein
MAGNDKPWILRGATLWAHFRSVPIKRLWILISAVFLLFSVTGFYVDLLYKGVLPYAAVLAIAVLQRAECFALAYRFVAPVEAVSDRPDCDAVL